MGQTMIKVKYHQLLEGLDDAFMVYDTDNPKIIGVGVNMDTAVKDLIINQKILAKITTIDQQDVLDEIMCLVNKEAPEAGRPINELSGVIRDYLISRNINIMARERLLRVAAMIVVHLSRTPEIVRPGTISGSSNDNGSS